MSLFDRRPPTYVFLVYKYREGGKKGLIWRGKVLFSKGQERGLFSNTCLFHTGSLSYMSFSYIYLRGEKASFEKKKEASFRKGNKKVSFRIHVSFWIHVSFTEAASLICRADIYTGGQKKRFLFERERIRPLFEHMHLLLRRQPATCVFLTCMYDKCIYILWYVHVIFDVFIKGEEEASFWTHVSFK